MSCAFVEFLNSRQKQAEAIKTLVAGRLLKGCHHENFGVSGTRGVLFFILLSLCRFGFVVRSRQRSMAGGDQLVRFPGAQLEFRSDDDRQRHQHRRRDNAANTGASTCRDCASRAPSAQFIKVQPRFR